MRRRRTRGFRIGKKLVKVFKWMTRSRKPHSLTRPIRSRTRNPMKKFVNLAKNISYGAKRLCSFNNSGNRYIRVGEDPGESGTKPVDVPKGHLAVYVGESRDDTCRVTVPVIYFNHPLFGELLEEAEKVYGHNHTGGIKLPCGLPELERVQMRIAAADGGPRMLRSEWSRRH